MPAAHDDTTPAHGTEHAANRRRDVVDWGGRSSARNRRQLTRRRRLLTTALAVALFWPLPLIALTEKPGSESIGTVFAAGIGYIALTGIVIQVVLPSRLQGIGGPFGIDVLLRVHRVLGMTTLALVLVHVGVLFADDRDRIALLDVTSSPLRAKAAVAALAALLLIAVTSLWRRRVRLRYESWRLVHLLLSTVIVAGALVHVVLVEEYAASTLLRWAVVGFTLCAAFALFTLRVLRPLRNARRRYVLVDVRQERGSATTLQFQALGHDGLDFSPGQFVWLKPANRPFVLVEHPFSIASSACRRDRPAVTIKHAGDFTSTVGAMRPGTVMTLDGPHGSYAPQLVDQGFVLIVGGVGITPAMSIIRTLADLGDPRPVQLVYGSTDPDAITFREELDELERSMNLHVVHVLSHADAAWSGERGFIDVDLLDRVLPRDAATRNVFVCGPPAMVDSVEAALEGFTMPHHVHVERFGGV